MDHHLGGSLQLTGFDQARAKACKFVDEKSAETGIDMVLVDQSTREEPWCWVFFYNSRAFLETGAFSHALPGNGPILVEKDGGAVRILGTGTPVEDQLEKLRSGE